MKPWQARIVKLWNFLEEMLLLSTSSKCDGLEKTNSSQMCTVIWWEVMIVRHRILINSFSSVFQCSNIGKDLQRSSGISILADIWKSDGQDLEEPDLIRPVLIEAWITSTIDVSPSWNFSVILWLQLNYDKTAKAHTLVSVLLS